MQMHARTTCVNTQPTRKSHTLSNAFIPLWITIHSFLSLSLALCLSSAFHSMRVAACWPAWLLLLPGHMRSVFVFARLCLRHIIQTFWFTVSLVLPKANRANAHAHEHTSHTHRVFVRNSRVLWVCVHFKSIIQGLRNEMLNYCPCIIL